MQQHTAVQEAADRQLQQCSALQCKLLAAMATYTLSRSLNDTVELPALQLSRPPLLPESELQCNASGAGLWTSELPCSALQLAALHAVNLAAFGLQPAKREVLWQADGCCRVTLLTVS